MAIIKCPECGHQISEKATRCPSCGVEIAGKIVRCDHCGEVYFNDEILCPNCHAPQPSHHHGEVSAEEARSEDRQALEGSHEEHPAVAVKSVAAAKQAPSTKQPESDAVATPDPSDDGRDGRHEEEQATREQHQKARSKKQENREQEREAKSQQQEEPIEKRDRTSKEGSDKPKSRIMPFFVSLAIASIVGAVSIYFYKESKGSKEQQAYELVQGSSDTLALSNFLSSYSDAPSTHLDSIRARLDLIRQGEIDWDSLQQHKTHEMVAAYVLRYTNMPHYTQAVLLLDSIDWAEALSANTPPSYQRYLESHPEGRHMAEARERMYAGNLDVVAPEERQLVAALVQRLFQSINDNDAGVFKSCLSPAIVSFMGTAHPSADEAAGWMRRQHGESVRSLSWAPNDDYEIVKRKKDGGSFEYAVKFSAKQDMVKGGKSTSDKYKVTSVITPDGKLSTLGMVKIVPEEGGESTTKPSSGSSSVSTTKPSSSATKPSSSSSSSSSSTSKPKTSSSSSSSTSNPKTSSSSSSSTSKPKTGSSSSSSGSSTSKPKTSSSSSSSSSSSKPKTSTSSSSSSKAKTSSQKK